MARRRSKARKPAKKPRKTMKMAAKPAKRVATRAGKKAGIKLGKPARRRARMSAARSARTRPITFKTIVLRKGAAKSTEPANPFGIHMPEMPFGYGRDSVVSALVVMLILFAVISAGIFYPQTKAPQQSLMVVPAAMHNK